jgi:hypothetical protein
VAFGQGGKRIFLYSSQLGQLWAVDAGSGNKLASVKAGKRGHALGLVDSGRLLLVRSSGLWFFSAGKRLRRRGAIAIGKLYSGFSHVEGSLVFPKGAVVRNGDRLYFLSFPAAR